MISSINCLWLQVAFQFPQQCFQSIYITSIAKRSLPLTGNSTIYPRIGAQNPPIGLYILILTAVGLEIRPSYVVNYCTTYSQVEHAFKAFIQGTYKEPPQFSNENVWHSLEDFRKSLLHLDSLQWDRILDVHELPEERYVNNVKYSTLSAYRGGLVGFSSP